MSDTAEKIVKAATRAGVVIATAESCTGGMVATALTDIPGSSAVFDRGFVTYSYESKTDLLGVDSGMLEAHGAVNEETVIQMAQGARDAISDKNKTRMAVSVSGIAGPDGGSADKPVGLVWFGLAVNDTVTAENKIFPGTRDEIRRAATEHALNMILAKL